MSAHNFSSPDLIWWRARKCENGACAEVAAMPGMVALRNSRNPHGPVVLYTADEWITFLDGARSGDKDPG